MHPNQSNTVQVYKGGPFLACRSKTSFIIFENLAHNLNTTLVLLCPRPSQQTKRKSKLPNVYISDRMSRGGGHHVAIQSENELVLFDTSMLRELFLGNVVVVGNGPIASASCNC